MAERRSVIITGAAGGIGRALVELAVAAGEAVIAVDLPPFGFSDRQDGDYSRIRQARRINALAAAMNLRNYLMVGHSYGGGVALEAALGDAAGERRLAGLVLVCAVVNLLAEGESEAPKAAPALLTVPIVSDALVAGTIGNPLLTATLARRFMHRKEGLTARDVEILQRPMARRGNGKAMLAWLTQFLAEDDAPLSRHAEKVRQLAVPVSLVWGEEDMVTPIAGGEALAAEINPRAFFRLKGIGHMPQLEDRDGFAGVLLDALDALPGHDGGPSEGVGELRGTHDAAPQ